MGDYDDIRFRIFANISQVANRLQNVMDIGMTDITTKQWLPFIMIGRLDYEPTLKEVAEMCGITHQSAKQLIDKLEEKGYVYVRKDAKDKRFLRISLTEKGEEWSALNLGRNAEFVFSLFSKISEDELRTFDKVQTVLIGDLDRMKTAYLQDGRIENA